MLIYIFIETIFDKIFIPGYKKSFFGNQAGSIERSDSGVVGRDFWPSKSWLIKIDFSVREPITILMKHWILMNEWAGSVYAR